MSKIYIKKRLTFSPPAGRGTGIEVDGTVIAVLSYDGTTGEATVLIEREATDPAVTFADGADEEDPAQARSRAVTPEKPTCGHPTDNGPCGRTVSNPDDYCWQHP